jgi:hypothetical protein
VVAQVTTDANKHGVFCAAGCDLKWARDPVLEVACPDCGAGVGVYCRRPSGHANFGHSFHAARDIAADRAGAYGVCPLGKCGLENAARIKSPEQPSLF